MNLDTVIPQQIATAHTKEQLAAFALTFVNQLVEEGGDSIGLLAQAARLEYVAACMKEAAKTATIEEVRSYGKAGITRYSVTLIVKEAGVKYDYSGDPTWTKLNASVTSATEARKAHECYLKSLPYGGRMYVCEETGDMYRAYPPGKRAGETVFVEIK